MDNEFRVTAQELPGAIESLLFVSGDPISVDKLSELLNVKKAAVEEALKSLMSKYKNNPWGGLEIRKIEESYAMMTRPEQKKFIERLYAPKTQVPLSQASYETLAVIAYNQPCTRAQVETVRGVSSDSIISRLLDRGWIEEAGCLDAPGRPALFATSRQFLTEFGIESVDDLPPMELMSYQTIRDMENSLREAAGGEDKQITIDSIMGGAKPEEQETEGEEDNGND
ncbi:MAG: SMC-Scp complex subunit ScpB [Clostridiales bacterium]|nr:SMC-Scp complex subunit ScpB [Clostridiales bacterium]MBR6487974.1 SMC-Scp complex subunit ScpB [Clostridiales bacterium]